MLCFTPLPKSESVELVLVVRVGGVIVAVRGQVRVGEAGGWGQQGRTCDNRVK
jgi:hypothetical protein